METGALPAEAMLGELRPRSRSRRSLRPGSTTPWSPGANRVVRDRCDRHRLGTSMSALPRCRRCCTCARRRPADLRVRRCASCVRERRQSASVRADRRPSTRRQQRRSARDREMLERGRCVLLPDIARVDAESHDHARRCTITNRRGRPLAQRLAQQGEADHDEGQAQRRRSTTPLGACQYARRSRPGGTRRPCCAGRRSAPRRRTIMPGSSPTMKLICRSGRMPPRCGSLGAACKSPFPSAHPNGFRAPTSNVGARWPRGGHAAA